MVVGYAITLALAILLLCAYLAVVKKKEPWLLLLFVSVVIVNLGYLMLSAATTLDFAILANDIAYFGSVWLSACMFLIIVGLCGFRVTRWHVGTCAVLAVLMFAVVATSGWLPWYYREVSLEIVNGVARLVKVYGVLHPMYLVYLVGYFLAMIVTIFHSVKCKTVGAPRFAALIACVVVVNMLVWLFEKFIRWEFEFLSITYIGSELLLMMLYWMIEDYVRVRDAKSDQEGGAARLETALSLLPKDTELSAREYEILLLVLENKKRREIAEHMHLSENTVKTYTRNLYNKLGVASREELYSRL